MEDKQIVALYWAREESAIRETAEKYGTYCHSIAYTILQDPQDAQECVNDTYMDAWNTMPPNQPSILATFLGKITRRISIDRLRIYSAKKRGGGQIMLALEELEDCVSGSSDVELQVQRKELIAAIHSFLDSFFHCCLSCCSGGIFIITPVIVQLAVGQDNIGICRKA